MGKLKTWRKHHKLCMEHRGDYRIKWNISTNRYNNTADTIFLLPTIIYVPMPYRFPKSAVFEICWLWWYISIGEFIPADSENFIKEN